MFDVGKTYVIHEIDGDGVGYHSAKVLEWAPPLLKVDHPDGGHVIHNIGSANFHKAELSRRQSPLQAVDESLLFEPEQRELNMSMDKSTFRAVRVAVYVGGLLERGIIESEEADSEIHRLMDDQGIAFEHFDDIEQLTHAFVGFGDSVRAAERKKRPITKIDGENLSDI